MPRHDIGQQLHRSSSGSTPHDRVTIPQNGSSRSMPLDRPRQSALRHPAVISNRPGIHRIRPDPPLMREPLHRRPACWSASTPITHLIRGAQIPIAHAAPPTCPLPRFPPLEVFGRRPPVCAEPSSWGRHPKTFTYPEVSEGAFWPDQFGLLSGSRPQQRPHSSGVKLP